MKAVVLHEYGGPEKLKLETDVPDPEVRENTVLIAATAASVNPIDWKVRSGARQKDFPLSFPAILGRDVSGIVRAVGANVSTFRPGDRVLSFTNATYAELVAVDESAVAHLPDGVELVHAAALPLITATGDQLVRLAANVRPGQTVVVTGALGSVGRAAVHAAKKMGARVVAGVRQNQLQDAALLNVHGVVAVDDN
jgi:NADPH:quinone reductase-like Zn-dependent oxidoreductase